jgi:AcrR family transcriptional regulator
MQKGYEKTTMQDILEELQLSKGAIYHHFKSKEEILAVVIDQLTQQEIAMVNELAARAVGANGKEKIQNLIVAYLTGLGDMYGPGSEVFMSSQPNNGSQFVLGGCLASVQDVAPIFAKLIEEGVADGSLVTEYPLEAAEIFMLLFGFWTKPTVFNRTELETRRRVAALQDVLAKMGVDVFTDEAMERLLAEYRRFGIYRVPEN